MLWPPPRSHEADAGGLGFWLLSVCGELASAIMPTAKHPTARNTTDLFMVFPPQKPAANIETDLPVERNCNCRRLIKTYAAEFCFALVVPPRGRVCEKAKKGSPRLGSLC